MRFSKKLKIGLIVILTGVNVCVLGFGFTSLFHQIEPNAFLRGLQNGQTTIRSIQAIQFQLWHLKLLTLELERNVKDFFISNDSRYLTAFQSNQMAFSDELSKILTDPLTRSDPEFQTLTDDLFQIYNQYTAMFLDLKKLVQNNQKAKAMQRSRSDHFERQQNLVSKLDAMDTRLTLIKTKLEQDYDQALTGGVDRLKSLQDDQRHAPQKAILASIVLGCVTALIAILMDDPLHTV